MLFEQVIIEFERALITSCQLFELLFDRRSRLDPALQNADLTLNLPLPLYQVGNAQIILAYSRTQLLNRWRLNSSGLRIRGGATAFWRFAHSPFQLLNLILGLDHVGMIRGVARLKHAQLVLQGTELLVQRFCRCVSALHGLPGGELRAQQRLVHYLVLLRAVHGLGDRI